MTSKCELLISLIRQSPYLKTRDQEVLDTILDGYFIDSEPGLVNDYLRVQNELEACVVYLTGKYGGILARLETEIEDKSADIIIDMPDKSAAGYKLTREDRKLYLLSNKEYLILREHVRDMKYLFSLLEKLSIIVFRRANKLEQLSINYRREVEADKRHSDA